MLRHLPLFIATLSAPVAAQVSWCPLDLGGLGDANNVLAAATVEYAGCLYVGTVNASGAQLSCYDGSGFAPVPIPGFSANNGGILAGVVHQGTLVLGTINEATGAEVWRYDGNAWSQIGSSGLGGGSAVPAIDQLAVFNGDLYAGMDNQNSGSQIMEFQSPGNWTQRNPDGFGCGTANAEIYGLTAYAGQLYATTNNNGGSQVWRWNGVNPWARIDPGGAGCGPGGFFSGGADTGAHALKVLGTPAALYVGTENANGAEVWRYDGGWSGLFTGGFGDPDNFIVHDFEEFGGVIYAVTENQGSGGEVWRFNFAGGNLTRVDPGAPSGSGGFGSGADNAAVFELAEFQSRLIASTFNLVSGAQVWRLGLGVPYCAANPNSTGEAATICAEGSNSSSAGDLTLISTPVPNTPGIFFHGETQIQTPFGDGFRCAGGAAFRGAIITASGNLATYTYDNSGPQSALASFVGSTRRFQHWYRDPLGAGAGFNTSNAVSILVVP